MRVLALGGLGFVGRHAVPALRALRPDATFVIADRDADAAARFAAELGDAESLAVDVTDRAALDAALADADLVMNTVGPYFRFGVPILTACIDAGCTPTARRRPTSQPTKCSPPRERQRRTPWQPATTRLLWRYPADRADPCSIPPSPQRSPAA